MRKFILSAVAAGAVAFAGAASAQGFGGVLNDLFGFGRPAYPTQSGATPAVVAGAQPYGSSVYVDPYGRQVTVDPYGRQVVVQPNRGAYGITGYDAWGRPVYGSAPVPYGYRGDYGNHGNYAYAGQPGDKDGDGVPNVHDRYPDDARYR
jgi:hypothetical protein